jgi:tRNA pseudouridine55 synthase
MDGVLVIDKPAGPTSHDVVAVARRALGERRIGHTGTLDPMATGVLALACGRATRLVSFLTASEKEYVAEIRFGVCTDSYDVTGLETSRTDAVPSQAEVLAALDSLRGEYLQAPPPVSAKKIDGQRAYALARAGTPVQPAPVAVRVPELELLEFDRGVAVVRLVCSSGFYVRALAHSMGEHTGTGACLQALRRLRAGDFGLSEAVGLDVLADSPESAWAYMVTMDKLLPRFPLVTVTSEGLSRLSHGRDLTPEHVAGAWPFDFAHGKPFDAAHGKPFDMAPGRPAPAWVRLTDAEGRLVALAEPEQAGRALHPSIVLG